MARYVEHGQHGWVRVVRIPWNTLPSQPDWLGRFNRRFGIDKGHYDGTFTSPLGPGYCTGCSYAGYRGKARVGFMSYTFTELRPKNLKDDDK